MPPRPPLSPPPPPRRNMPAVGDWSDGAEATRGGLGAPRSGVGAPGWGVGFAVCDGSGAGGAGGGVLEAGPGSSDFGVAGGAFATSFGASGVFGAARGAGAGAGGAAAARALIRPARRDVHEERLAALADDALLRGAMQDQPETDPDVEEHGYGHRDDEIPVGPVPGQVTETPRPHPLHARSIIGYFATKPLRGCAPPPPPRA